MFSFLVSNYIKISTVVDQINTLKEYGFKLH